MQDNFKYSGERFADIQMLRYKLEGFEELSLRQKLYIYYLSQATLAGRDITFDQNGRYNLRIRRVLEAVYKYSPNHGDVDNWDALVVYLKRVWFSSGIHHHYGCEKFVPDFSEAYFRHQVEQLNQSVLPLSAGEHVEDLLDELCKVIFTPDVCACRVNQTDGEDLVVTSACNFYEGVSQREVEAYYEALRQKYPEDKVSWGLNSKLVKTDDSISEQVWKIDGMYDDALRAIVFWLEKAKEYAENEKQIRIVGLLITYYKTGDLHVFDNYSIEWLQELDGQVDFINGFIEVYGDPLGRKGTWEGLVEYKDLEATRRTQTICANAQWFEDNSPVDARFKKPVVKGVTANVINAAMLGGDEYPASAIGINLPNADWIRTEYGSKSVTIGNLTSAYNQVAKGNGFLEEFVGDDAIRQLIATYGDRCDNLHTDLHECLGHGSGRVLPGISTESLKAYANTIEEARADLFGLYYVADSKLVELGLLDSAEAYKSQYYTYLLNGLLTQNVRIKEGQQLEEAHMRNRALIGNWILEHSKGNVKLIKLREKIFLYIDDYQKLRSEFGILLKEVQRIKSEGDLEAARQLVETYGVKINPNLHHEVLERYKKLNIAPYKGFLNPWLKLEYTADGSAVADVVVDYTENYEQQMMRYSTEYATLI
uniref:Dihydrofolate reductase n=1 Tax=Prevotella sp. GTC17260 TaxID=3236796 RepID=A0AB33J7T0_9BACT